VNGKFQIRDIGRQPYGPVFKLQERLVADRLAGHIPDTLILVEHDPVYTLGRNADAHNVVAPPAALREAGIEVVRTTRGGDVTYHGPGQIVGYPILDLRARGEGVVWYVGRLEEVLIRLLAEYGIEGQRDRANRGVWVRQEKVAALGVRVTRGITMHGFALNVTTDLRQYGGIIPCGIRDRGVTSLDRLVPGVTVESVKPRLVEQFKIVFGYLT
jgi:lipoyl(octanoyl) transferase